MNKQFWNALHEAYPQAVKEFYAFILKYALETDWNSLFGKRVFFQDLPVEMQLGIWIKFLNEQGCGNSDDITIGVDCFEQENLWEWTSEWFRNREININIEKE